MRDDTRPTDGFAWTRPWVPYGDDPFVWYDPAEDMVAPAAQPVARTAPAPANDLDDAGPVAAAAEAVSPPARTRAPETSGDDMWVELPAVEDKPKRARRSRSRGRGKDGAEAEAHVVADTEAEAPEAAPAPAPVEVAASPEPVVAEAPAPVAAAGPAPEPEVVAAPAPARARRAVKAAVPVEDPAEITTPPPAPRKGWWRRG
jgi:ribonuclease E